MSDYLITKTISGSLPSLKNQRRIVTNRRTGKPFSIKSQVAMTYETHFMSKINDKDKIGYDGPVSVRVRIWYPTKKNDLDIEFLCDLLQRAEIIKNDRQIMHKEAWKGKDKDNPRTIFTVYPYLDDTLISHTIAPQSTQTTVPLPPDGVKIRRKGKSC